MRCCRGRRVDSEKDIVSEAATSRLTMNYINHHESDHVRINSNLQTEATPKTTLSTSFT
jgi:hypothetical protein